MANTQLDAQYELFSKGLFAYFNEDGKYKPLLNSVLDAQGYEIDKVFDNPATGLQAIGLRSKDINKPPVLVYQGGNGDAGDTDTINDPNGFGFSQFSANKQEIQDWLVAIGNNKQLNPQGLKPDVTGESIGGALTQLTASEFPTLIGSAVSFVSPGISRKTADKFIENGGNPEQVRHYIRDGDITSLEGEAFIPGKVVVAKNEIPEADQSNYIDLKHVSGILGDLRSVIPETGDPALDRLVAPTNKPSNQTLSEISVDELNQPNFTWQGEDWLAILEKVRTNNPNLAEIIADRQSVEEFRFTNKIDNLPQLFNQAVKGENPITPDRVDRATDGDDILFGTECNDRISGLAGADYIKAGAGNDLLLGNAGKDGLVGGSGNDTLNGGAGDDILTGGKGKDRFIFGDSTPFNTASLGVDRINDFTPGEDLIGLSKATFPNLGKDFFGTVTDDASVGSSAAAIVYNTSNGSLFYNPNGVDSGLGTGGQFASIFGQPTLAAQAFKLI
jgi:serralysin